MATAILKGTIVITGTNGDLGHSIAARIASSHDLATNYYGIYAVRDSSSAGPLLGALQQEQTPGSHPHQVVSVNLERLDNVRELAESINNQVPRGEIPVVRTLILNAGYLQHEKQRWVEGDLDVTWVVNYLSQWLLTLLLLQSMDRDHGRIIVLGPCSHIHDPYDKYNYGAMGGYFDDDKWKTIFSDSAEPIVKGTTSSSQEDPSWRGGLRRYGAAKLCLAMMM